MLKVKNNNFGLKTTRWKIAKRPFKHCVVNDFFEEDAYRRICEGFVSHREMSPITSAYENYDAVIKPITKRDSALFEPLFSTQLLGLMAAAFRSEPTYEIDAATHVHPANSRSGWIHNDYNPGWFAKQGEPCSYIFSGSEGCNYQRPTAEWRKQGVMRVRYLTAIFYLLNDDWRAGDGGITGIYSSMNSVVEEPEVEIEPRNNTMLIFECGPHAYHSFIFSKNIRNSITFWQHRTPEAAKAQWPYHELVAWK